MSVPSPKAKVLSMTEMQVIKDASSPLSKHSQQVAAASKPKQPAKMEVDDEDLIFELVGYSEEKHKRAY